jgi:hypothetical protein
MTHYVDTHTGYCKSCDKQEYNVFQVQSPSSLDLRNMCSSGNSVFIQVKSIIGIKLPQETKFPSVDRFIQWCFVTLISRKFG